MKLPVKLALRVNLREINLIIFRSAIPRSCWLAQRRWLRVSPLGDVRETEKEAGLKGDSGRGRKGQAKGSIKGRLLGVIKWLVKGCYVYGDHKVS